MVLFEVFTFHPSRFCGLMADRVQQFSKDLPVIVRRIVQQRRKTVNQRPPPGTTGLGTGDRLPKQRIEDMVMRPLVLVGALAFLSNDRISDPSGPPDSGDGSRGEGVAAGTEDPFADLRAKMRAEEERQLSSEIHCCEELRCLIGPSDPIDTVVRKMGSWEARSFDRLRVEIAIGSGVNLIGSSLNIDPVSLSVHHRLDLPTKIASGVAMTLQKILCGLIWFADPSTCDSNESVSLVAQRVSLLAREIKEASVAAQGFISTPICVVWQSTTPLVLVPDEVADFEGEAQSLSADPVGEVRGQLPLLGPGYHVFRHPSSCDVSSVRFGVNVQLDRCIVKFLCNLRDALIAVRQAADSAMKVIDEAVQVRCVVQHEEFISREAAGNDPLTHNGRDAFENLKNNAAGHYNRAQEMKTERSGRSVTAESRNMRDAESMIFSRAVLGHQPPSPDLGEVRYEYRAPIRSFVRIFNMPTEVELLFWKRLFEQRQLAAKRCVRISALNVFYNCAPYRATECDPRKPQPPLPPDAPTGWCEESIEGDGDNITIKEADVQEQDMFAQWLEEVTDQALLSAECQTILDAMGARRNVLRDPELPLCNFLSFVKLYAGSPTVHSTLCARSHGCHSMKIIVGWVCDVSDGGKLRVPWTMDPRRLISFLEDPTSSAGLQLA
jgi:hypothetical protein